MARADAPADAADWLIHLGVNDERRTSRRLKSGPIWRRWSTFLSKHYGPSRPSIPGNSLLRLCCRSKIIRGYGEEIGQTLIKERNLSREPISWGLTRRSRRWYGSDPVHPNLTAWPGWRGCGTKPSSGNCRRPPNRREMRGTGAINQDDVQFLADLTKATIESARVYPDQETSGEHEGRPIPVKNNLRLHGDSPGRAAKRIRRFRCRISPWPTPADWSPVDEGLGPFTPDRHPTKRRSEHSFPAARSSASSPPRPHQPRRHGGLLSGHVLLGARPGRRTVGCMSAAEQLLRFHLAGLHALEGHRNCRPVPRRRSTGLTLLERMKRRPTTCPGRTSKPASSSPRPNGGPWASSSATKPT